MRTHSVPDRLTSFPFECSSLRCFEGQHLRYLVAVGIPGFMLVCFCVPVFIILVRARRGRYRGSRLRLGCWLRPPTLASERGA